MQHSIYREEILEHFKDPQNFGKLPTFDISSRQHNPFCGDDISVYIKLQSKRIGDIRFDGQGCAISIAGGSMITEYAKGKLISEVAKFSAEDMLEMLAVEVSETRKKCALLAYATLMDCLKNPKL
jgi:nitrogen fixation NifU-like protein